jgi:hypothetical protein
MPNPNNILSPLTIVGNGRSGTSLVSRILGDHPQCQFAGETANLIHSVWKSLESSLIPKKHDEIPEIIRQQFLYFFPNPAPFWMHKPIGVPIVWRLFDEDEFLDWYWDVMLAVFPQSRFFTVLRHPLDVVVSSHQWWGWSIPSIINSNRLIARIITHPKSPVTFGVNYHELIRKPRKQTRRLLDFLELKYDKACLNAFKVAHVVNEETDDKQKAGVKPGAVKPAAVKPGLQLKTRQASAFSHQQQWQQIDPQWITPDYREAIDACWARFGFDFGGWPSKF